MDIETHLVTPVDRLTPYQQAQRLGWMAYRHTGALYLPELVIAGVLRIGTRKPDGSTRATYDNGYPNLRRHPLLIGDRDFRKGSIVDLWRTKIVRTVNYADPNANPKGGLVTAEAQGGSTWESGRGGASNNRLVLPTYYPLDILYVPELMAWLGHDPKSVMKTVEQLNNALQEGRVTVDLAKMKGMPEKELKAFAAACADLGIMFNPAKGILYYEPDFIAIFCTREPPFAIFTDMRVSGLISRLAPIDLNFDEATLDAYLRRQHGPGDAKCLDALRTFHDYLWQCSIASLDNPDELANLVVNTVQDEYRHLADAVGRSRREFRHGREAQYASQLLTFSALCRAVTTRMALGKPPGTIDALEYTQADVDFTIRHIERYLFPVVQKSAEKASKPDPRVDSAYEEAIAILADYAKHLNPPWKDPRCQEDIDGGIPLEPGEHPDADAPVQTFPSGDFHRFYIAKKKVSWTTYHERVYLLQERTALAQVGAKGRERIYRISDAAMESFGLRSERQWRALGDDPTTYEPPIEE